MARNLDFRLAQAMLSERRQPAFRVFIYDIRSGGNTINDIVREQPLSALTGPREFTDDVLRVSITEQAGDYVNSGIAASEVVFDVSDPNGLFSPLEMLVDPIGDGRWLRPGNVIRVIEGDEQVDESLWVPTFTGLLVGQAGFDRNRTSGNSVITCKAVGREAGFLKADNTTVSFAQGTSYLQMATDIAQLDLGLDEEEIDFAGFGSRVTGHRVTQFVEEPALVSIAKIMFVDGFLPRFNGEGKLTQSLGLVTAFPDRVYPDQDIVREIVTPFSEVDVVNSVCVLGLDATLTRVVSPLQDLTEVQITTGYFTHDEDFDSYFSEDRTLVAQNIRFDVIRSVQGSINFAGGEEFELIGAPGGSEGYIGVTTTLSTGFAPALIITLTVSYIAAAWIPDEVLSAFVGVTLPYGRVTQALVLIGIMIVMTQIGRLHVIFRGEPIEYVFKEIRACARRSGILSTQLNEVEIENHLVQDQSTADSLAREVLFRQQARALPRSVIMLHDLVLEPDDTLELPDSRYGPRRFLIQEIARTLERGRATLAEMSAFEVTSGLAP